MNTSARIVLDCAAGLIAAGGLYDVFTPRLPANLSAACDGHQRAVRVARELLRALGGCLVAIGLAVAVLVNLPSFRDQRWTPELVLLLVLPSEGLNAVGMYRAGSPFQIPLGLIAITSIGVLLS